MNLYIPSLAQIFSLFMLDFVEGGDSESILNFNATLVNLETGDIFHLADSVINIFRV